MRSLGFKVLLETPITTARTGFFLSVNEQKSWRRITWDLRARRTKADGETLYGQHWYAVAGNDRVGAGSE
jgi:hypothetical protein